MSKPYPEIETGIKETALKESKKRGFSECKVDREDIERFWSDITTSSCTLEDKTAEKVVFRNDRDTDHTVPYTKKQTTVSTVDAEIKYGMQLEMENDMKHADLNLSGVAVYNSKETVEIQLVDVPLAANSEVVVQDTLRKTKTDIEVRALQFYTFRVYPGHPIAKAAAIWAAAGTASGAFVGMGAGAGIGSVIGLIGGPIGIAIGGVSGAAIGVIVGAITGGGGGSAVGAGFGVRKRKQRHFNITAKEVFEIMPGFREDGQFAYCTVRDHNTWKETHYTFQ